jgi:hypothetical protein
MTREPISTLSEVARLVHGALFPDGAADQGAEGRCLPASLVLVDRLRAIGIDGRVVAGEFWVERPGDVFDEVDHDDDEDGDPDDESAWLMHYWVMVGSVLCDITCGQFDDLSDDGIDPTLVCEINSNDAWRHRIVDQHPQFEILPEDQRWIDQHTIATGPTKL